MVIKYQPAVSYEVVTDSCRILYFTDSVEDLPVGADSTIIEITSSDYTTKRYYSRFVS